MNYLKLRKLNKLYFPYQELSGVLGITSRSAKVFATRYVEKGYLIRLRRNFYILRERWDVLDKEEKFALASIIEVPSYVSLMTAMDYYGITTQLQRDFIESISIHRTKEVEIEKNVFNYTKINKQLYSGFIKKGNFFIATPEKAFLDALYLMSLKRYKFDLSSIDFSKLNKAEINKLIKGFPEGVKALYRLRRQHVGPV